MANVSCWTVPRDGSSVQPWTSMPGLYCPFSPCLWKVHSGHTAVVIRAVVCDKDHLCNYKDYIFLHFSLSFLHNITDAPFSCNLYIRREVLPGVVVRQLTQSARSLVSCSRSSRTGGPAALLGCHKNRCRLPPFIDLLELHAALFLKWPAVHSFSTFLYLHDYRLCNNSTLHTRSGFSVLYWLILQQYE
jgi:hypothetical protein